MAAVTLIWICMSSVAASTTLVQPLFSLQWPPCCVFMCAAKSYRSLSSPQPCQGMSVPQIAKEPGSARSDLIRAPLASAPALHNQFLTLFLVLIKSINFVTELRCLGPGSCWFKHRTLMPPEPGKSTASGCGETEHTETNWRFALP